MRARSLRSDKRKRLAKDAAYLARKRETERRYRTKPETRKKLAARNKLKWAVEKGLVTRMPCEVCGAEPSHGHHENYDYPLAVRWLCSKCHGKQHRVYA